MKNKKYIIKIYFYKFKDGESRKGRRSVHAEMVHKVNKNRFRAFETMCRLKDRQKTADCHLA